MQTGSKPNNKYKDTAPTDMRVARDRGSLRTNPYVFKTNRRFEQAGCHHIVHALSAELDVLDELLASPTLEQMGLVPDRFAFLLHNGYLPRRNVYVT